MTHTVYGETSGKRFGLEDRPLALGGEAAIFPVSQDPDLVAKVYHTVRPEQAAKLLAMLQAPPADLALGARLAIAWPRERLFDAPESGRCVGYLMPRVRDMHRLGRLLVPRFRRQYFPGV